MEAQYLQIFGFRKDLNVHFYFYSVIFLLILFIYLILSIGNKIWTFVSTKSSNLPQTAIEKFRELPSFPMIGPGLEITKCKNDGFGLLTKWRQNYGTCWRTRAFGKDLLFIHDPRLLKSLLSSKDAAHLEKEPILYKNFVFGATNNGLIFMPVKKWAPHRKALAPLFTYDSLKSYIGIYEKHAEQLVEGLMAKCEDDKFSENPSYNEWIHLKLLDIITEITVGKPFEHALGTSGAKSLYEDLKSIIDITGDRFISHQWTLVFPTIWNFHPLKKKLDNHIKNLDNAIEKLRKLHVPRTDSKFALDLMINLKWTDEEILAELETVLLAGHETVSSALCMHLWMLALAQDHQKACQQEIDEVFEALEVSGEKLSLNSLSQVKHVERCIKESLRLFPVVPIATIRELKSPLVLDDDMELKPGTVLTSFLHALHRDPEIYPDPEKFDPDRFLPENVRKRHAFAYLPFSAGARNCIGWKAALMEMTVLTAVLLRNFHIKTTDARESITFPLKLIITPSRYPTLLFKKRELKSKS